MDTYEKKYKEALERATKAKNNASISNGTLRVLGIIFPELQESEGEKIIKAIKQMYSFLPNKPEYIGSVSVKDIFTWLEKQAQVKETAISLHENKTCKENDDSLTSEDEKIRKELIAFIKRRSGCDYDYDKWLAWLEKQKDYVSPQMVADAYLRGCNDTEKKWLEKQRPKPLVKSALEAIYEEKIDNSNKVEPKLKKIEYDAQLTEFEDAIKDMMNAYRDAIGDNDATIEEVKKHAAYMLSLIHQKSVWTEEDDYNVRCCIAKAESDIANGSLGRNKELIEWLKSLKQRMEQ